MPHVFPSLCAIALTVVTQSPTPPLRVGSAAVELKAEDSMVIGGGIGPGRARGQEGKLRVVATVIQAADGSRVALVACDILMINRDYLDAAAQRISAELDLSPERILVSSTHTHHAPTTVTIHGYERDQGFCVQVRDGVVEAVRRAARRLADPNNAPVDFLFRLGEESSVGQNSRILLGDGSIFWVGRREDEVRPTGPFDPELPVLAFRRRGGGFESVLFNHSTHLIGAYEPGKRSPGFYCLAAQELETELGGTVTYLSGACGSTHNLKLNAHEMSYRIKSAVRDALQGAQPQPVPTVRAIKREIKYRVRHFDEAKDDAAVSSYCRSRVSGDPMPTIEIFRQMRAALAPHQGEERTTWIQVVALGDVVLVGLPGEVFTRLGVEIKRRSPFRYTYVAGLANDYIGYIPDGPAHDLGGYQTWTGFHSFLERGTGERFVDAALGLLGELAQAPSPGVKK